MLFHCFYHRRRRCSLTVLPQVQVLVLLVLPQVLPQVLLQVLHCALKLLSLLRLLVLS